MTIPHKPELSGVKAIYVRSDDETEKDGDAVCSRDVIAWDKLGRPLVQCGDRLMPAAETKYARHRQFLYVEPSTKVEDAAVDEIQGQIADRFYDVNIGEMVYDAIEKAVAEEVAGRFREFILGVVVYDAVEKAVADEVAERFGDIDLKKILRVAAEKAVAHKVNSSGQES